VWRRRRAGSREGKGFRPRGSHVSPRIKEIAVQLFLIRGLLALVWDVVFAVTSRSLSTDVTVGVGILLVIYALIDVVASLIDARGQRGSAGRLLRADAAVSALAAAAFAIAATGRPRRLRRVGGRHRRGPAPRRPPSP
jgi:small-conductance mechanosensitive channel